MPLPIGVSTTLACSDGAGLALLLPRRAPGLFLRSPLFEKCPDLVFLVEPSARAVSKSAKDPPAIPCLHSGRRYPRQPCNVLWRKEFSHQSASLELLVICCRLWCTRKCGGRSMRSNHNSRQLRNESREIRAPRYAVLMNQRRRGLWYGEFHDWPPDPETVKTSPHGLSVGVHAQMAVRWFWGLYPESSEPFLVIGACNWLIKKSWDAGKPLWRSSEGQVVLAYTRLAWFAPAVPWRRPGTLVEAAVLPSERTELVRICLSTQFGLLAGRLRPCESCGFSFATNWLQPRQGNCGECRFHDGLMKGRLSKGSDLWRTFQKRIGMQTNRGSLTQEVAAMMLRSAAEDLHRLPAADWTVKWDKPTRLVKGRGSKGMQRGAPYDSLPNRERAP
jgi:hypothetical protein